MPDRDLQQRLFVRFAYAIYREAESVKVLVALVNHYNCQKITCMQCFSGDCVLSNYDRHASQINFDDLIIMHEMCQIDDSFPA